MSEDPNAKVWQERWAKMAAAPFLPLQIRMGQGHTVTADERTAHALEYIAAQLGEINRREAPST